MAKWNILAPALLSMPLLGKGFCNVLRQKHPEVTVFFVQVATNSENTGDFQTDVMVLWLISAHTWQARRRSLKWFPQGGVPLFMSEHWDGSGRWFSKLDGKMWPAEPGRFADLNSLGFHLLRYAKGKVYLVKVRDKSSEAVYLRCRGHGGWTCYVNDCVYYN